MKLQPRFYKMRPQDNLGAVLLYFTALIVGLAHAYVNEIEARHSTVFEFDTDTPLPLRIDSFCAEHRLSSLSCAQLAVFAHDRAGHVRSPRMEEAADAARRAVRAARLATEAGTAMLNASASAPVAGRTSSAKARADAEARLNIAIRDVKLATDTLITATTRATRGRVGPFPQVLDRAVQLEATVDGHVHYVSVGLHDKRPDDIVRFFCERYKVLRAGCDTLVELAHMQLARAWAEGWHHTLLPPPRPPMPASALRTPYGEKVSDWDNALWRRLDEHLGLEAHEKAEKERGVRSATKTVHRGWVELKMIATGGVPDCGEPPIPRPPEGEWTEEEADRYDEEDDELVNRHWSLGGGLDWRDSGCTNMEECGPIAMEIDPASSASACGAAAAAALQALKPAKRLQQQASAATAAAEQNLRSGARQRDKSDIDGRLVASHAAQAATAAKMATDIVALALQSAVAAHVVPRTFLEDYTVPLLRWRDVLRRHGVGADVLGNQGFEPGNEPSLQAQSGLAWGLWRRRVLKRQQIWRLWLASERHAQRRMAARAFGLEHANAIKPPPQEKGWHEKVDEAMLGEHGLLPPRNEAAEARADNLLAAACAALGCGEARANSADGTVLSNGELRAAALHEQSALLPAVRAYVHAAAQLRDAVAQGLETRKRAGRLRPIDIPLRALLPPMLSSTPTLNASDAGGVDFESLGWGRDRSGRAAAVNSLPATQLCARTLLLLATTLSSRPPPPAPPPAHWTFHDAVDQGEEQEEESDDAGDRTPNAPTACLIGATVSARAVQEVLLPWLVAPVPDGQSEWRVVDVRLPNQLSPVHWGRTHQTHGQAADSTPAQAVAAESALRFLVNAFPGRVSAYKLSNNPRHYTGDDALRCSVVVVHRVGGSRDSAAVLQVLKIMQRTVPKSRVYTHSGMGYPDAARDNRVVLRTDATSVASEDDVVVFGSQSNGVHADIRATERAWHAIHWPGGLAALQDAAAKGTPPTVVEQLASIADKHGQVNFETEPLVRHLATVRAAANAPASCAQEEPWKALDDEGPCEHANGGTAGDNGFNEAVRASLAGIGVGRASTVGLYIGRYEAEDVDSAAVENAAEQDLWLPPDNTLPAEALAQTLSRDAMLSKVKDNTWPPPRAEFCNRVSPPAPEASKLISDIIRSENEKLQVSIPLQINNELQAFGYRSLLPSHWLPEEGHHCSPLQDAVNLFVRKHNLPAEAQKALLSAAGRQFRNFTQQRLQNLTSALGHSNATFQYNPTVLVRAILPVPAPEIAPPFEFDDRGESVGVHPEAVNDDEDNDNWHKTDPSDPVRRKPMNMRPCDGMCRVPKRPLRLFVHSPERCTYLSRQLQQYGEWEPRLSRELLARFGPGAGEGECRNTEDKYRTLLDIGGHVGWYSLLVAAAGHRSIVLEPMRYNRELLEASVKLNGLQERVRVVNVAAGAPKQRGDSDDALCMMPMGGHRNNSGNGQIFTDSALELNCMERVRTRTIDEMLYEGAVGEIFPRNMTMRDDEALRTECCTENWERGQAPRGWLEHIEGEQLADMVGEDGIYKGYGAPPQQDPLKAPAIWEEPPDAAEQSAKRKYGEAAAPRTAPPPIFAAKIDVEGFETRVLHGASRLLSDPVRRPCFIFLEHDEQLAAMAGARKFEVFELLMGRHGYRLFRRGSGGGRAGSSVGQGKELNKSIAIHAALADARVEVRLSQLRARLSLHTWRHSHDWELRMIDERCSALAPAPLADDDPVQVPVAMDGSHFPIRYTRRSNLTAVAMRFCHEHGLDAEEHVGNIVAGMRDRLREIFSDRVTP